MPTAFYTVRVETNYGDFMEFEFDYEVSEEDAEEFDPMAAQDEIYHDVLDNLYIDVDFSHLED